MIYITGDCHSDFKRFSSDNFPEQKEMTRDDYVIICGDFGGVWSYQKESNEEKYWLNWLAEKNFTILFVDGNHENFDRLYSYPVEEWHCGKIHKIRDNVFHLMRGEVFNIEGKTFFTFGGASSHDIQDGIYEIEEKEKIKALQKRNAYYRVRNLSWWDLELPTKEEMQNGLSNLEKVNFKVDYIITHCAPTSIQTLLIRKPDRDILTDYLDDIDSKCEFKKWYFGHYHADKYIDLKFNLLYERILRLC